MQGVSQKLNEISRKGERALETEWDIKFPSIENRNYKGAAGIISRHLKHLREHQDGEQEIERSIVQYIIERFLLYARKRKDFWVTEVVKIDAQLFIYAHWMLFSKNEESKTLCKRDYYIVTECEESNGDMETSFTLIMLDCLRNVIGEIKFLRL